MSFSLEIPAGRLTTWSEGDWAEFASLSSDPEVMRYISLGVPWPEEKNREWIERQRRFYAELNYCMWRLEDRATRRLMGFCGLQPVRETPDIEIGWWLHKQHWGQGIATQAARAALADGFERIGLKRIVAVAMPGNGASRRIMEKIGLSYEREIFLKGYDLVQYAITRD